MNASFVRGERVSGVDREKIVAQGAEDHDRGKDDEWIEDKGVTLDVLAVLERDVKIGKQETEPEVRAP